MPRLFIAFAMLLFARPLLAQEPKTQQPQQDVTKPMYMESTAKEKIPAPAPDSAPAASPAAPVANPDGSGFLHVYRHRRYEGSALAPSVFIDDKQVARVGNGRRFTAKLTPGSHTVRSDDKSSAISLTVKPGEDYYVRIDEKTGLWKGHGQLTLILPEQGKPEYAVAKPVEADRQIAKDMLEADSETPSTSTDKDSTKPKN